YLFFFFLSFVLLGLHPQHMEQKVEVAVQQLHGKVVGPLGSAVAAGPGPGPPALAEEQQPVGLSGAEVQGDGASALGAPAGQRHEGLRALEVDGP
uniref:Uncharacterized protein n=1 Tax=Sus scrofa TaxID=9823 RepID=A0A8D0PBQ3_PIG